MYQYNRIFLKFDWLHIEYVHDLDRFLALPLGVLLMHREHAQRNSNIISVILQGRLNIGADLPSTVFFQPTVPACSK